MTSNTLWTQQLLNILIRWLRDQTCLQQCYRPSRSGPKEFKRNPSLPPHLCFLVLLPSSPVSEATDSSRIGAIIGAVKAEAAGHWRRMDTWSVVTVAPLLDHWSLLLEWDSRLSKPAVIKRTVTWLLYLRWLLTCRLWLQDTINNYCGGWINLQLYWIIALYSN